MEDLRRCLQKGSLTFKRARELVQHKGSNRSEEDLFEQEMHTWNNLPTVKVNARWAISEGARFAMRNLFRRVDPEVKQLMTSHLNKQKVWLLILFTLGVRTCVHSYLIKRPGTQGDHALWTTEHLRRSRWLLGSNLSWADASTTWQPITMVSGSSQILFLKRAIAWFEMKNSGGNSRAVRRWTVDEWDMEATAMAVRAFCTDAMRQATRDDGSDSFSVGEILKFTEGILSG